jgi:tRNA A37 threonylcarbamoyladenosine dehydratase
MKTSNNSNSAQLAVASFLLGSAVTYYLSTLSKAKKVQKEPDEKPVQKSTITIPPEMRSEQLSRNELYFGQDGMKSIVNSSILIVGLGGVGSHTAHMLARAGVSYIRLVDFDQVTLSSLNRHACATLEDVGIPKVTCLKNFLRKICGDCCEIDARVQMYTGDKSKDGDMMDCPKDRGDWDVIIDAIDDVPTKAQLVAHCVRKKIRVISCMGAGGKSDMTRLHISDLRTASRDPLASKLRQVLKRTLKNDESVKDQSYLSDVDKVAVMYSSEKVVCKLADFTEKQKEEGVHKFGAVDNMRIRVIPVLGTMPAIMGQSLAAMALCEIGGKPFSVSS